MAFPRRVLRGAFLVVLLASLFALSGFGGMGRLWWVGALCLVLSAIAAVAIWMLRPSAEI